MIQHTEMPTARQKICLANSRKQNLNKENAVADIKSYATGEGWWVVDGTYQCYGMKIIGKRFFKKKMWNCISLLYKLKSWVGCFLVGIIFNKLLFMPAASITSFLHAAVTACFSLIFYKPRIRELTHAIVHMQRGTS